MLRKQKRNKLPTTTTVYVENLRFLFNVTLAFIFEVVFVNPLSNAYHVAVAFPQNPLYHPYYTNSIKIIENE